MAYLLKSFVNLMEHGVVSWDTIEPEFTKKVAFSPSSWFSVLQKWKQTNKRVNLLSYMGKKIMTLDSLRGIKNFEQSKFEPSRVTCTCKIYFEFRFQQSVFALSLHS